MKSKTWRGRHLVLTTLLTSKMREVIAQIGIEYQRPSGGAQLLNSILRTATTRSVDEMNAQQWKIAAVFVFGTGVFAAAHQGAISQGTAMMAMLALTALIRFGLLKLN
jgi:hypothetical protein